ncbi:MAG: PorT family protein [Bacteroidales bacterium]|nr:PorT family protein [Bacteroidales bacterium]
MKKFIILICLLCPFILVNAQDDVQRAQVSARVGLGGTTMLIPNSTFTSQTAFGYSATEQLRLGVTGGLIVDIHLKNRWFLQTGVMYGWQRFHQEQFALYDKDSYKYSIASENLYTMHRVKVPLMVYYHTSLEPNHFMVGLGLFADVALGGKLTYDASAKITDPDNEITDYMGSGSFDPFKNDHKYLYYHKSNDDFTDKYDLYRGNILNRFNFGLAGEVGYQISKFYVGAHVDFGLANMMNKKFAGDNYVERLFSFQVMLGYKIN